MVLRPVRLTSPCCKDPYATCPFQKQFSARVKLKCKVHAITCHEVTEGSRRIARFSLTLAVDCILKYGFFSRSAINLSVMS
jgi:hypothetical protein